MEKIGKYKILGELGKGGMGLVYKGFDEDIGRDVAIKVISDQALEIPEIKSRFIREARTAGRLAHENIATVYELGESDGKIFIVMEYLPGKDLRMVINAKERLTLTQKLGIATQVCRGLQFAHSNGVIHRDIKPENIKILDDGRVKIIDFGIAKPETIATRDGQAEAQLTMVGARVGTPWYMSPEQVKGLPVDRRSDIFSFGVVLYELLTYRKPFEGDDTTVLYKILHVEPERIQLEESGLVEELQELLSRCLAKDLGSRFKDCSELLAALSAIPDRDEEEKRIRILLAEGYKLVEEKRFNDAIKKFGEVLQINPNNPEANAQIKKAIDRERETATMKVLTGRVTGELFSHFKIIDRLGGGGMGVVFKAEDITLKRIVALKFLTPELTRDPQSKKRFLKEAQAASALDHPNIGTIHEIGETEDGLMFICMTYYDGVTLKERMSQGIQPIGESISILTKIARGLTQAHKNGIVHRDIKPANIILTKDNEVKIVDFGLAKLSGGTRITQTGVAMGTLPYMSPEQIKGIGLDARSDIWSLGVLMYELLTGTLPFRGDYDAAVMYAIVNNEPEKPSMLRPEIAPAIENIIRKALTKSVDERYKSMEDMLDDLVREGSKDAGRTKLTELIETAKKQIEQRQLIEALSAINSGLKLDPKDPVLLNLKNSVSEDIEKTDRIAKLYKQGSNLYSVRNFKDALIVFKKIIALDPEHRESLKMIETIEESLKQARTIDDLIADAEFCFKRAKFVEAIERYKEVIRIDQGNEKARSGLKRAEERLKTTRETPGSETGKQGKTKSVKWLTLGLGVGIVMLIIIWRVFHVTDRGDTPLVQDAALSSKQTMLGLKAEADESNSGTVAAKLYSMAKQFELEGDDAFSSKQYGRAVKCYTDAASNYRKSFEQTSALSNRQAMLASKSGAQRAGGDASAAKQYSAGAEKETTADKQYSGENYLAASQLYQAAGSLYDSARFAGTGSLGQIEKTVNRAHQAMLVQKSSADRVNASTKVPEVYRKASMEEQQGDRAADKADPGNLLEARRLYGIAELDYKLAAEKVANWDVLTQQQNDAQSAMTDMGNVKGQVPGSDGNKSANGDFRKAMQFESDGQSKFKSGDFLAAKSDFMNARNLYDKSMHEIGDAIKSKESESLLQQVIQSLQAVKSKITAESQSEDAFQKAQTAETEAVRYQSSSDISKATEEYKAALQFYSDVLAVQTSKQAIRRLIEQYKTDLEQRDLIDLKSLLHLSTAEETNFSKFFKESANIVVTFDKNSIQIDNGSATADAQGTISFDNISNNRRDNGPARINWTLKYSGGQWMVVSHK